MGRSRTGITYRGCYVPPRAVAVREKDWQQVIIDAAQLLGWQHYHTHNSKHSVPGFPDLILAKPPRLLAIECKTELGKVTPAQQQWLDLFAQIPGVTAMVARPSDWKTIESLLKGAA